MHGTTTLMSNFLLRIEAIEAKVLSYSCPRGTSGRLHSLRLRRRFQHPARSQSAGAAQRRVPQDEEDSLLQQSFEENVRDGRFQDIIGKIRQLGVTEDYRNPEFSNGQSLEGRPSAPHWQYTYEPPEKPPKYRGISKHTTRARRGDTFYEHAEGKNDAIYTVSSPHGDFKTSIAPPTVEELYESLRRNNPYAMLQFATRFGPWYRLGLKEEFQELPANTFSELLHSLDPDVFLGRYQKLHKEIASHHSSYNGLFGSRRSRLEFRDFFMKSLKGLIKFRLIGGHLLSLSDYQHFMRCARAVGDPRASETIWKSMSVAKISPDTICYNHYLAAKVQSDILNGDQRHKVRVTPRNLEVRQWPKQPIGYEGYRVGDNGLKHQISLLFDKMTATGTVANEETMCLMMVGLAKEGDIDGVKNILNKVWGIHVDKLLALGEEGIGLDLPADSPTQPSSLLLQAVAHVFGINNSIPVALRLVDFVSRRYSLEIPLSVWEELLERTFVLSITKGQKLNKGFAEGSLPATAVSNLWATLTAEPYNVQPTMFMYDKLLNNLFHQQRFGQAQERMEEARSLHKRDVAEYGRLVARRTKLPIGAPRGVFQKLDSDITFVSLRVHRNRQYIRQWCRQLIKGLSDSVMTPEFNSRGIHRIVHKWKLYLPRHVEYKTPTGFVRFPSRSKALNTERVGRFESRTMGDEEGFVSEDSKP